MASNTGKVVAVMAFATLNVGSTPTSAMKLQMNIFRRRRGETAAADVASKEIAGRVQQAKDILKAAYDKNMQNYIDVDADGKPVDVERVDTFKNAWVSIRHDLGFLPQGWGLKNPFTGNRLITLVNPADPIEYVPRGALSPSEQLNASNPDV
jgi:hypothetical protein